MSRGPGWLPDRTFGAVAYENATPEPDEKEIFMAYLQITLKIEANNRAAAAGIYTQYKAPFLETIKGAKSKELLVRDEDVQVLHGFDTAANAKAYMETDLFNNDVVTGLKPLLAAAPEIRIYDVA